MYKLEYLPVARKDMIEIVRYISRELQNPDAADRLAVELVNAAESVLTFPYAAPAYQPIRSLKHEYRKILVQNYLMFYWVDEEERLVTVARVVYAKLWPAVGVMGMERLVEVTLEIDAELKEQAEKVFAENGMTLEEATILFFEETVRLGRLPFELDDDLREYIAKQLDTPASDSVGSSQNDSHGTRQYHLILCK